MSTHNIPFSTYKRKSPLIIQNLQLWDSFQGAQERVRNSRGKRAISVRATEVLLYMAFLRWCGLQPHLRPSSTVSLAWLRCITYKSLNICIYRTQYTFVKTNTHRVCDPSYYKNPTRIVLSVARCFYETIVGKSCDSRTTHLTIIARFIVRVIFVKKAPVF